MEQVETIRHWTCPPGLVRCGLQDISKRGTHHRFWMTEKIEGAVSHVIRVFGEGQRRNSSIADNR